MSTTNQLSGGSFQDVTGNPIANGTMTMVLSQDATVGELQIAAGTTITIKLDADGNVLSSPAQSVWPNDVLTPASTFYMVSVYTENGQLVWGPNAQQVLSTPTPYDVGVWVPGNVSTLPTTQLALANVTLASTASAGSAALPSNPVAFLPISVNGFSYKIALYAV